MKAQLRHVQEGVDTILLQLGEQSKSDEPQPPPELNQIPLKTIEDVDSLAHIYQDKNNRDSLVRFILILTLC